MTLLEIKQAIATYLKKTVTNLTIHDQDMGLLAMNQVRMQAELLNDFGFMRKFVTIQVDGVTGGSLDTAIEYGGTLTDVVSVKSIVDVGIFDSGGNFRPVDWTTVEDSLNTQRAGTLVAPRFPTDAQAVCGPFGGQRFMFGGNNVFVFPQSVGVTFSLAMVVYAFTRDWTVDDLATSIVWSNQGAQYLQWASIVQLNHQWKDFVFRQEGNLPPPQTIADQGLANLVTWDAFRYVRRRRNR